MSAALWSTAVYALGIFAVTAAAGFVTESVQNKLSNVFPYVNALSCGIVLGAAFTHLLPDAIGDLEHLNLGCVFALFAHDFALIQLVVGVLVERSYPVACACALLGFTFLCGLECVLHGDTKSENVVVKTDQGDTLRQTVLLRAAGVDDCGGTERVVGHHHAVEIPFQLPADERTRLIITSENSPRLPAEGKSCSKASRASLHQIAEASGAHRMKQLEFHKHSDHFHTHISTPGFSTAGATIFWAALFAHSVMEGIGLGVTTAMQQLTIFWAIVLHKGFASMALSIALLESGISKTSYRTLYSTFACAAPCGTIIGYFVHADAAGVGPGVMTAVAAGSFLYIGTVEMLPIMLRQCENRFLALACFVLGAALFAGLAAFV